MQLNTYKSTTAASAAYAAKHLTSSKLLKDVELMKTYADYSSRQMLTMYAIRR